MSVNNLSYQVVSLLIDQQLKTLLHTSFHRSLSSSTSLEFLDLYRTESFFLIDMMFSLGSLLSKASPGMLATGIEWSHKGSAVIYIAIMSLEMTVTKIRKMLLQQESISPNDIRLAITKYILVMWKIIQLYVFLGFIRKRANSAPTALLQLSGFTMDWNQGVIYEKVAESGGYKPAQLYIESRKFLWYAMIGFASAASITLDWVAIRRFASKLPIFLWNSLFGDGLVAITGNTLGPEGAGEGGSEDSLTCAVCNAIRAENVHILLPCKHTICYICGQMKLSKKLFIKGSRKPQRQYEESEDESLRCPQCSVKLDSCEPWQRKFFST